MSTDSASNEKKTTVAGINLLKLAKLRKFSELEEAWMAALEEPIATWEAMLEVPTYLARSNEIEQAVLLLWAMVTAAREKLPPAEALEVAKRCALVVPGDSSLKKELAELYVLAHSNIPEIQILVNFAGLKGNTPAGMAIERMERFLAMRPGTYVHDKNTDRIGRVEKVDPQGFTLNLGKANAIYNATATDAIEILAPDDLRALVLFETERIESLREDNPAELVRLALKTYGGRLEFRQLKERLTAGAIPSSAWSSWWAKAKEAVKRSPLIEMTDDAQPYMVLRKTPLSYQERIRRHFQAASTPDDKFALVLDYLHGTQAGQPADKAVSEQLVEGLQQLVQENYQKSPIIALGALAVLGEFRRRFADLNVMPCVGIDTVLAKISDFSRIPTQIKNEHVLLFILAVIKDNFQDLWPEIYAKLMPGCSVSVCDAMSRELLAGEKHHALAKAIKTITQRPESYPEAFIWLWKTACSGRLPESVYAERPISLTVGLLSLGDWAANLNRPGASAEEERARARSLITQIRHTIAANDYRIIRRVFEGANTMEAQHLRDLLNRNRFLSEYARNDLIGILSAAHHDLFVEVKKPWEEAVIYTTEAGLKKRQQELEHIVNVELPKVAEAIGRAISYGDVSDNAEYRAGLEHRDNLSKRAAQIRAEIAKARLITSNMVTGTEVTVGAKVTAKALDTGQTVTFCFLGPWDTDIPNHIYSYQAPFSLAFMGKKKGDTVTVPGTEGPRTYEILDIASAV